MKKEVKIIAMHSGFPLENHLQKLPEEQLAFAGWQFANATLWQFDKIPASEERKCIRYLLEHLLLSKNSKSAFKEFCQNAVIEHWLQKSAIHKGLPSPSEWLSPENKSGFQYKTEWHEQIIKKRKSILPSQDGLVIVIEAYLRYAFRPSKQIFKRCKNRLLKLKEHELFQIFCNAIINFNF